MIISLEKKLQEWKKANLIDAATIEKITSYESNSNQGKWAYYGFIILGIVVLSTGIISIVASHWEQIPGYVKIIVDLVLLFSTSVIILYSDKNKQEWFPFLVIFYFLLIPASIGLISQVFNTSGEFYQLALVWTLPFLPLLLQSKLRTLHYLWLLVFTFGIFNLLDTHLSIRDEKLFLYFFIDSPFIFLFIYSLLKKINKLNQQVTSSLLNWSFLLLMIGSFVNSLSYDSHLTNQYSNFHFINYAAIISLIVAIVWLNFKSILPQLIWWIFPAVSYMLLVFPHPWLQITIVEDSLFILIWIFLAILFSKLGRKRLFDMALFITALRFIHIYIYSFGGLLSTGIGMLFTGAVIIFATIGLLKYKENLFRLSRGTENES